MTFSEHLKTIMQEHGYNHDSLCQVHGLEMEVINGMEEGDQSPHPEHLESFLRKIAHKDPVLAWDLRQWQSI
ncbi:hypothetical protein ACFL35_19060 [Candidatus Riflebacteria bacterium]